MAAPPLRILPDPNSEYLKATCPLCYVEGDTVYAAAMEYERREGRRSVKGWTLGTVHPAPDLSILSPTVEFRGAPGSSYLLMEGICADEIQRRRVVRYARRLHRPRSGYKPRWHIDVCDVFVADVLSGTGIDLGDLAAAAANPASLSRDEVNTLCALMSQRINEAIPPEDFDTSWMVSPLRHEPLRVKVEGLLSRKAWPTRIVAVWGAAHLPGIERDVWFPLGFRRLAMHWQPVARILPEGPGADDVVTLGEIDAEFEESAT